MARAPDTARIRQRLRRMPAQRDALRLAVERFGGDFDLERWSAAFDSEDPRDINTVVAVTGGFQGLVNHLVEMLRSGARLADLEIVRAERMPSGADLIGALRDDGCFSAAQARNLTDLYRIRNRLQHASPDVAADEVHEAVGALLRSLPRLLSSFAAWLERNGVSLVG